jgi:Ca2+-binding RTX toxin-like protein
VTIDLAPNTASGGDAQGDTISGIENVMGSETGADTLRGDDRANRLAGLGGNDVLEGRNGDDVLMGGDGNDTLSGGDGEDNITGDDGSDTISGGAGNDIIAGGDGDDAIHGDEGADIIDAGAGDDLVFGDAGDDRLSGGEGDDALYGGDGNDVLSGGEGDDRLEGGLGDDTYLFSGAEGGDLIVDADGANTIVLEDVAIEEVWLTRDGDDLVLSFVGDTHSITVQNYYAASGASRVRSIQTSSHAIFLPHAEPLIAAMTAAYATTSGGQAAPPPPGLIAAYAFAEGSGATTANAISGNYSGAFSGSPTWSTQGPSGSALALNGSDTVNLGVITELDGASAVTIEAWVKRSALYENVLIGNDGVGIYLFEDVIGFNLANGSQGASAEAYFNDANWHHVALVYDASQSNYANRLKGYVDGVQISFYEIEGSVPATIAVSSPFNLGTMFGDYSDGSIDDVRIYNRALSQSEVQADMTAPIAAASLPELPAAHTQTIHDMLASYWFVGGKAAPQVSDQDHATDEDAALSGAVGAVDPDANISLYAIATPASHGIVDLNAETGAWVYQPAANYHGDDSFSIRVTDADGQSAMQEVRLVIAPVNDAPHDIALEDGVTEFFERDNPILGDVLAPVLLGTLNGDDIDSPDHELVYQVSDARFEVVSGSLLRLKAGAAFDFETQTSVDVEVVATDGYGAGLGFAKTFTFAVLNADDYFYGSVGADVLTGQAGRNIMSGFVGNDTITGAGANDSLDGGDGADQLFGLGGDDELQGGLGDDQLDGGDGADALYGGAGNDTLSGAAGNDVLYGEGGLDTLNGGDGADSLYGGDDNDELNGGDGDDRLEGGAGNDVMSGGAGAEVFLGGDGVDTITYASATGPVTVDLAAGGGSAGEAAGDVFEDKVDELVGSAHGDSLTGSAQRDIIYGGDGNDTIRGGAGDDDLYGGAGDDYIDAEGGGDKLIGGAGADTLIGGDDNDTYVIDIYSGADEIWNFDPSGEDVDVIGYKDIGHDRLWLERVGDDLLISVIGTDVATTVKNWYVESDPGDRASFKIDFVIAGENFTREVNTDGLVALMAGETKPADMAAFDALRADPVFGPAWTAFWEPNEAPEIGEVTAQTTSEDAYIVTPLTFVVRITDDVTPLTGLTVTATAVRADDPSQADTDLVQVNGVTIGAPDGNGDRVVAVLTKPNASGAALIKIVASDAGGLLTEKLVSLTVTPVADEPDLEEPLHATPAAPLSKPTLEFGSWLLNVQAALQDQDGSETLIVQISGVPSGIHFVEHGTAFERGTSLGEGVWSFTPAELVNLAVTGPESWTQNLSLTVTAIATETATEETASSTGLPLDIEINAGPTAIGLSNATVNENAAGAVVGVLSSTDPDITGGEADSQSFSVGSEYSGPFEVHEDNGTWRLRLKTGIALNFENAAQKTHVVPVIVTDSGGLTHDQNFTVTTTDVNEAPTALNFTNTTTSLAENTSMSSRRKMADLVIVDDALGSEAFSLSGADAASFEVIGATLYLKAGTTLNYEAKSSYAVTVRADDSSVGANPDVQKNFTLTLTNVNEAPSAPIMVQEGNATIYETPNPGWAGPGTPALNTSEHQIQFASTDPENAIQNYVITGGTGAGKFSIDSNGKLAVQDWLDYESGETSYTLSVKSVDVGGLSSPTQNFTINLANANEAPYVTSIFAQDMLGGQGSWASIVVNIGTIDPDDGSGQRTIQLYSTSSGIQFVPGGPSVWTVYNGPRGGTSGSNFYAIISDAGGATRTQHFDVRFYWPYTVTLLPVVLDLDGDGVELVSLASSDVWFDMNGDGMLDRAGWVGADDGILAFDRNGNGLIDDGSEIAFGDDVDGAVSDLEGLSAYDTNENGLFDEGDAQFAEFRIWQDVNQDGISQAEELTTLAERGIDSIGLTLSPTGVSSEGATDSGIYATSEFTRDDQTIGLVGDVFLVYDIVEIEIVEDAGQLPPIVFDLDGDGVRLSNRANSGVMFDADGDGTTEGIGWFSAGDGVLALDRNGDGLINDGLEISFVADLPGAVTDLEGLAAFDSNENGAFDYADARFGEFLIWRDANQDGVSQSGELKSLANWDIAAINLTKQPVGPEVAETGGNIVHAMTDFERGDGSIGFAADVALSYDLGASEEDGGASVSNHRAGLNEPPANAERPSRVASDQFRRRNPGAAARAPSIADMLREHGAGTGGAEAPSLNQDEPASRSKRSLADSLGEKSQYAETELHVARELEPVEVAPAPRSVLHRGLGLADKRLLAMVNALSAFDPQSSADLSRSRRVRDPRVAELLTSLPDIRE